MRTTLRSRGEFGGWLAKKLVDGGLTYSKIANDMGISTQTVLKHVHCRSYPRDYLLHRYSLYFGEHYEKLKGMVMNDKANHVRISSPDQYVNVVKKDPYVDVCRNPKGYFGKWLTSQLSVNRMPVKTLCERTGCERTTIYRYIHNSRHPKYPFIALVCDIFNEPDVESVCERVRLDKRVAKEERYATSNL